MNRPDTGAARYLANELGYLDGAGPEVTMWLHSLADEVERLRGALQWLEDRARDSKLEIAPSLLGGGFEFGFWSRSGARAKVVTAKTLLEAVEAARRGP